MANPLVESLNGEKFLSFKHITKVFSGNKVLDDVTFDIHAGEIMGLIGENGAGKSTLIKIICGIYDATEGSIELDGYSVSIPNCIEARKLGICLVPQEFNLINSLTVYENIFLGNEIEGRILLNKQKMRRLASEQLEALQLPIDVNRLVSDLSVAEKQMVEIAKALMIDARVLILDEPTTTLTSHEVDILFNMMRRLKQKGVTMMFVSHKLREIRAICDRVTVLRDGKLISVDNIADVDENDIVRKMIGRDFNKVFPPKLKRTDETIVLDVQNFTIDKLLHNVNFNLRKGEIIGFAGLVGAGRTETMEALMGLRPLKSGTVRLNGKNVKMKHPKDAVQHKIGYISEDRQGKGIVQMYDMSKNISLISLGKKYLKTCFIDKKAEEAATEKYIKEFNIIGSRKNPLKFFSGGNQQKVYLSRWMDIEPEILILDEPTRGIDVKAKTEIYDFIHRLAQTGISCIIVSSEMEEILGLCSRVYVMREGHIATCLEGNDITEEQIMLNATGIKKGDS